MIENETGTSRGRKQVVKGVLLGGLVGICLAIVGCAMTHSLLETTAEGDIAVDLLWGTMVAPVMTLIGSIVGGVVAIVKKRTMNSANNTQEDIRR